MFEHTNPRHRAGVWCLRPVTPELPGNHRNPCTE